MQRLDLTDNKKISNSGLAKLLKGCPKLVLLSTCQCKLGDEAFEPLGTLVDETVKSLNFSTKLPTVGRYLINLNLTNCINLTDNTLRRIATCPNLEELELFGNGNFTDTGLLSVLQGCPSLRSLHLQNCIGLTDQSCLNIAKYSTKLQYLDIYGCHLMTEDGIVAMLKEFPIKELNVTRFPHQQLKLNVKITSSQAANY